jgi:hypothetical protein
LPLGVSVDGPGGRSQVSRPRLVLRRWGDLSWTDADTACRPAHGLLCQLGKEGVQSQDGDASYSNAGSEHRDDNGMTCPGSSDRF